MKEIRYFYAPELAVSDELPADEAAHCLRVLRLQVGDEIWVTDGKGRCCRAEIVAGSGKRCRFCVVEEEPLPREWTGCLRLAVAPTKNMDRMEWLAEKATEIGFDELTFLSCRFSERKVVKTERIDKILVAAMKQSHKAFKPTLNDMEDFRRFVARDFPGQKFIAHCYEGEKPLLKDVLVPGEDALVLIGPEGDFSPEEVARAEEKGFRAVSLGKSRLRTETAALVAVHTMNLINS